MHFNDFDHIFNMSANSLPFDAYLHGLKNIFLWDHLVIGTTGKEANRRDYWMRHIVKYPGNNNMIIREYKVIRYIE